MINIFKHLSPAYSRILREFAIKVWYGRGDTREFYESAARYKKRYENELMAFYRKKGWPFRPEEIRTLADAWLADQLTVADRVNSVAAEKKDGLLVELDKLVEEKRGEVRDLLSGVKKPEGRVVSVVAFSNNFEAKAIQMGDDAAFDLATEINDHVVKGMTDRYDWNTQEDSAVRVTHRMLNKKTFSYDNPPTTIDQYGRRHTGNCGTDWGCRCFATPSYRKPLLNYVADARRKRA